MTPYETPQSTNCRTTNRRLLTRLPAGIRCYQIFRSKVDSHSLFPFFTVPDESDVCAVVLGSLFSLLCVETQGNLLRTMAARNMGSEGKCFLKNVCDCSA